MVFRLFWFGILIYLALSPALAFDPEKIAETELQVWKALYNGLNVKDYEKDMGTLVVELFDVKKPESVEKIHPNFLARMGWLPELWPSNSNLCYEDFEVIEDFERDLKVIKSSSSLNFDVKTLRGRNLTYGIIGEISNWDCLAFCTDNNPLELTKNILSTTLSVLYGGSTGRFYSCASFRANAFIEYIKMKSSMHTLQWSSIKLFLLTGYRQLNEVLYPNKYKSVALGDFMWL